MGDGPLDDLLRDVARYDAAITPPASLEERTMTAFATWHATAASAPAAIPAATIRPARIPHAATRRWPWTLAVAVGLAASILAAVVLPRRPDAGRNRPVKPTAAALADAVAPAGAAALATGGMRGRDGGSAPIATMPQASRAAMPLDPRRPKPRPRPRPSTPLRPVETWRFTPLMPDVGDDRLESFHLSRVQVPRRVLVDLGVLAGGRQDDETIDADVMFGEDGTARAIRLVPAARRIP